MAESACRNLLDDCLRKQNVVYPKTVSNIAPLALTIIALSDCQTVGHNELQHPSNFDPAKSNTQAQDQILKEYSWTARINEMQVEAVGQLTLD